MELRKGYILEFLGKTKKIKRVDNVKDECWFECNSGVEWVSVSYLTHINRLGLLKIINNK